MNSKDNIGYNRNFKDRVICLLFAEKKNALELYNGLNDSNYQDAEQLEIVTLEDAIYMKMKNDMAILVDGNLQLYEHQSSYNPNMPIRGFLYFADEYRQYLRGKNIYSTKQIKLPSPRYVVLYNGDRKIKEKEILKLSDAFEHGNEESHMELWVQMININTGHNRELMEKCTILNQYSVFVGKVKEKNKKMNFEQAVDQSIQECIEAGILREFLMKRRSEVMDSLLTEYDEEKVLAAIGQERFEDGKEQGREELLLDLIRKKCEKGQDFRTIAEHLEISEGDVRKICAEHGWGGK